ncbi:hypothetical protein CPC16_004817 [Podila verticillata]|nr:hypothetical protein BGZ52_002770 [Haplosporangium bisporale]KAF9202438.1 hypothetical protein BGZ59_002168 [Podila verticillata]KAF9390794.1 hypothetical protein CPC16_004817 [Podila verticillata]KAI9233391.1 MAG: quinon protein alcohol dehydrogenase-like superfamily [Podila humilis]
MAYSSPPSPSNVVELLAPSLCLNPDALEDLAPVQPNEVNLLPPSFQTLAWSEHSSDSTPKSQKRLCYRHRPDLRSKRAADEIQLEELQQDIKRLPKQDQQIISHIWSLFGSAPASHRQLVLSGLLTQCCVPQLSFLSNNIQPLLRIDFLSITPPEIAFRILSYLDATSLCHAAQVCKSWKRLADDDVVWHRMCEQHIGLKCTKCGWGLPLLEKKKVRSRRHLEQVSQSQPLLSQPQIQEIHDSEPEELAQDMNTAMEAASASSHPSPPASVTMSPTRRRDSFDSEDDSRSPKRTRHNTRSPSPAMEGSTPLFQSPEPPVKATEGSTKRPWKEIYSERLIVERNWRKRNYRLKEFKGHQDGVMCLQFDDSYLITGSYDNTAKVWNIETGECLRTLTGHALCIRALRFDEAKLITGSMDRTIKIWNYHTGQCIRTLQGHTDTVVTLDFDSRILASGSADSTIKIWNFATGECSTLTGHRDLVNKVQIYKKKFIVSASDDTTVKLWDIASRTCLRTFTGHVGRVQCLQTSGDALISIIANRFRRSQQNNATALTTTDSGRRSPSYESSSDSETRTVMPIIITGGLDNTLKVWNVETGECLNTLFGHEEGVWSLAFDKLRVVSGSLDKTIKVWDTESGQCQYTLTGHNGPVTCVDLGDTKVVSGSDDGTVYVWDYGVDYTSS